MKLLVDDRWQGAYGIARFGREVISRLPWGPLRLTFGRPATPFDPVVASAAIAIRRPDVYFTPGFCPPLKTTRIPYVMTVHDLIHLEDRGEWSRAKSAFYSTIVRPGIVQAAKVLTVSEYSRQRIVEWAGVDPDRVVVAPDGASSVFTQSGARFTTDRGYLLYVGNSKPHKNLRTLLSAMEMIGRDALELHMVGVDPSEITRLAEGLSVGHLLHIHENVPDEELAGIYRGASALVFPSRFEGFGLSVLEAMACGCPVVASDIPPVREVAGGAAAYFETEDPRDLADSIRRVMGDEAERERMVAEGLDRAALFTWDRTAKVVAAAIEQAAGGLGGTLGRRG